MNYSIQDIFMSQTQTISENVVFCPHCRGKYRRRGLARHIRYTHRDIQIHTRIENDDVVDEDRNRFIDQVFNIGFGAPLIN